MKKLQVKLLNLKIVALHGYYNYNVDFNPDVTLLYGENGCGKTTILNILKIITTGELFKLFNYSFRTIKLIYTSDIKLTETKDIEITQNNTLLDIVFNGKKYEIKALYNERPQVYGVRYIGDTVLEDIYFCRYRFLEEIYNTFSNVYLPLNHVTRADLNSSSDTCVEDSLISEISLESDLGTVDHDMLQIEQLIKDTYVEKMDVHKSVDLFVNTVNKFIGMADDGKRINVDNCGLISFSTKINSAPVSIQYLSSGEKQIVTFFAYFVFMFEQDKFGVLVVDEPELSLHPSWQRIFVQMALQVNDKIQLIFATHSPEFVSSYRDKMFRLKKNFIVDESHLA